MNITLKRALLFPSLMLTNIYLFFGGAINSESYIKHDSYSENIKLNSPIKSINITEKSTEKEFFEYLNLVKTLFILLSSLVLAKKLQKKHTLNKIKLSKIFTYFLNLKLKIQKNIFYKIKSINKIFHSNYYKIYFYSYSI
ncbi:hypothetical protein GW796_07800 [archaeon]|nr:hypothetical protein [archaeon]